MGSGSSKKPQSSSPAELQASNEVKPIVQKAPENRAAPSKDGPKSSKKKKKQSKDDDDDEDEEDWHGIDLAKLMHGLEMSEDKTAWEQYCDELISKNESSVKPEKKRKGWKTVRLFVSSTFKDFDNERDYLVKKVFPRLREWCEERKLRLIECDLRWGVPKDADTRETLMTCLSEIDRCREENGYPYFLSMLSERYGWVPDIAEVPEDIRLRYKWMPGMSVTTSEIMVGGYWDRNKHALYLLRTPEYLNHVNNEKIKAYFVESDPSNKHALQKLKEKVQKHYPEQVYSYCPRVEQENNDSIVLSGLEEMGERVLNHFKQMLENQYPTDSLGLEPSTQDQLRGEHETFMFQRSQVLLGRDENVKQIQGYINGKDTKPLILLGYPGSGKSALMAYNVKQCLNNEKLKVFYHFVGATPGSTDLYLLLLRMFLELMPKDRKPPEDDMEMKRFALTMFETIVQHALEEGHTKVVIFLDALNQMDDEGDNQNLLWLPRKLPVGLRLIVSTLEGKCLDALRGDGSDSGRTVEPPLEHSVDPLDKNIRQEIVKKILADYNKKLDSEQLDLLTTKEEAGKPLWLTVACEELRVFGKFRQLTDKVKSLPPDMTGLLEVVLRRVVDEYGKDLVTATLCLVETSRFGLLEMELLGLLAIQPTVPGAKHVQGLDFEGKLPMAKWALVYVGLRQFLRPCGSSGEGRLDFHHRTISKSVRKMYLSSEADQLWWHRRLAQYFESSPDITRKAEELPYHLEQAGDKDRLKQALLSHDLFTEMYNESNKQRLMKYWLYIGGYNLASEAYVKSLETLKQTKNLTDIDDYAEIQTRIAWFLTEIGEYDIALQVLSHVIDKITEKHGDMSKHLADPLHCMVHLLYKKALQYVYNSQPGYKECSMLGKKYSEKAMKLFGNIYGSATEVQDMRLYGRIMVLCGYFIQPCLKVASDIFEKIGDNQGMAQVLYMSGEKEQYNEDLSVPTKLFTMSMKLCLSVYGKVHLHTARCAQLYGQMYWNNMVYGNDDSKTEFLTKCLALYQQELEILAEIQGPLHPNTVRSREDVIIILQNLGRADEAKVYQEQQPSSHNAV